MVGLIGLALCGTVGCSSDDRQDGGQQGPADGSGGDGDGSSADATQQISCFLQ